MERIGKRWKGTANFLTSFLKVQLKKISCLVVDVPGNSVDLCPRLLQIVAVRMEPGQYFYFSWVTSL